MRKLITLLFFLLIGVVAQSATYYVSDSDGNDDDSGLTEALAWKTMQKVNDYTFGAGDNILFKKGDTFYGSLTISESGSIGSPITIGSYGSGANPIITGFTTIASWTNLGSNIWESTSTVSSLANCNMVTVNGVNIAMGRIPNTGFYTTSAISGTTSATTLSLSGTPNWSGADVVFRTNQWVMNRRVISTQSGGTITYPALSYTPAVGYGFFIQNDARTLDTQNEWFFDPATDKLKIYSTTEPSNVKIASVEYLFTIAGSYITIDGLTFAGANNCAIYNNSDVAHHIVVQNCSISFSGKDGIRLRKYHLTIQDNTVSYSGVNGIVCSNNKYSLIKGNTVQNSGYYPSIGDGATYNGIEAGNHAGLLVENNIITNSGYCGITFSGDSTTIKNNLVDTFSSVLQDGGGIYTAFPTTGDYGRTIIGNIVMNGIGAPAGTPNTTNDATGIYLDAASSFVKVHNNSIYNSGSKGILLNNPVSVEIKGNTIFDAEYQLMSSYYDVSKPVINNVITNNLFISKEASQYTARYAHSISGADLFAIGVLDSNYYARPIDDFEAKPLPYNESVNISRTGIGYDYLSLDEWKTISSLDANSLTSPQVIPDTSDFIFEYNATINTVTIALNTPKIDMKGVKYHSNITLLPYTSAVLITDDNPIYPDPPTVKVFIRANGLIQRDSQNRIIVQ